MNLNKLHKNLLDSLSSGDLDTARTLVWNVVQEIRNLEQELELRNQQIQENRQIQTEFLASITHELRTPLNSIIGYNSLLEEGVYGELTSPQLKAVRSIDRNATRLLALINQLLELSRLEAGIIKVHNEKINLVPVVQEILQDYQPAAEEKGLQINVACPFQGLTVSTDRDKIREIIRQLVSNAIRYTQQGSINVEFQVTEQQSILRIADTGPGIEPSLKMRIFTLFQAGRLDPAQRYQSAGVGLALAKRLADLLELDIDMESEPGKGSVFSVYFPVTHDTPAEHPHTQQELQDAEIPHTEEFSPAGFTTENTKSILIVDDDPYMVELLVDFFESRGNYLLRKAYSGMHAMIDLARNCPDYMLVDLLMPQINGERVIQYCRELWGDRVFIIIITGKPLTEAEKQQLRLKANVLIQKGEDPRTNLLKSLREYIPIFTPTA
ncbi:MAG: hybrid sensor histidine kinase/response regulator [bacterium]|jgi:signal transduction histidine kinase/CheY-like chemotaxis protein